jgi:hypothetical protein
VVDDHEGARPVVRPHQVVPLPQPRSTIPVELPSDVKQVHGTGVPAANGIKCASSDESC